MQCVRAIVARGPGMSPSMTIVWPSRKRQKMRCAFAQMRTKKIVPQCEIGSAITPPIDEMLLITKKAIQNRIERNRAMV